MKQSPERFWRPKSSAAWRFLIEAFGFARKLLRAKSNTVTNRAASVLVPVAYSSGALDVNLL
jgi:hypothetical protein